MAVQMDTGTAIWQDREIRFDVPPPCVLEARAHAHARTPLRGQLSVSRAASCCQPRQVADMSRPRR